MRTYSTRQAAKVIGIHPVTLHRWIAAGKAKASERVQLDGQTHWRWTERDVQKLRKLVLKSKKA